jgi:zinc protease
MRSLLLVLLLASAAGAVEAPIPDFQTEQMPNGLTLYVAQDTYQPVVMLRAVVLAGSKFDPYDRRGLAGFAAAACGAGVPGLESDALTHEMQRLGISFSKWAGYRASYFQMDVIRENWREALLFLVSMLTEPTLPEDDISRYRGEQIDYYRSGLNDDPSTLAFSHYFAAMYGRYYSQTMRTVRRISRDDIKRFHETYYRPDRTAVIAIGDFETSEAVAVLREALGAWPRGEAPPEPATHMPVRNPEMIRLVHKPDLTQATVVWGMPCMNSTDPDRFALGHANRALGGAGFASRLTEAIRSEGGRTYDISSWFQRDRDSGDFFIKTSTRNEELVATMDTIQAVVEAFVGGGVTEEEFWRAKSNVLGGYALSYETPSQVVGILASNLEMGLTLEDMRLAPSLNEAVMLEEVDRSASRWIRPGDMIWVVVGDKDKIGDALKARFGKVETIYYKEPLDAGNFLTRTRVGIGVAWNGAARGPQLSLLHRRVHLSGTYGFERRDKQWDYDRVGQVTLDLHRGDSEYSYASFFAGATGTLTHDIRGISPHVGVRGFPYALADHYSVSNSVGWSFWDVPEAIKKPRGFYWSMGFEYFF